MRPGFVIQRVGVGAMTVRGAHQGNDNTAAGEDVIRQAGGGEEAGTEGVD